MTAVAFSSKGQLVIPKALRDAKGFAAGVKVEIVDHPDGVLLKSIAPRETRPIGELSGILAPLYSGPALSIEEMNDGLDDFFATDLQWARPKA
jgi:AbrB family looped-hinge helix DNA binding protein